MNGSDFVPVKREWLARALTAGAKAVPELLKAIFDYAFEGKSPALMGEDLEYFNVEIAPEIDAARADWRVFDIRRAQFLEAIEGVPDNVRERYEVEFATIAYQSTEDFYNYLDEINADIKAIREHYGNNT